MRRCCCPSLFHRWAASAGLITQITILHCVAHIKQTLEVVIRLILNG